MMVYKNFFCRRGSHGITQSITLSTGSAWFDSRSLARLKRLVGCGMRAGTISFGRRHG